MNADRNLLFGILALQLDFIDRDILIESMNAWVLDKSVSLGEILVRRGRLTGARRQLLESLVGEHLAAHQADPQRSLAAVRGVESLRAELQEVDDRDIEASLAHLPASTDAPGSDTPTIQFLGEPTSAGGRFQVLRRHAVGGQGEVSIAVDRELHREVALKEIQARYASNELIRERFVREAEITGGLEHPGIVPVYGLGHYDDGRPYYAMRFVRGDSLKRAIERFHKSSHASSTERDLELRKLLRRLLDVCNAVHYAHSRGVLHRDLKPGNIMVGKYGETLIVDWGLATCQSSRDVESSEAVLQPPSASGSAATLDGSVIGTPSYMSPEQAAGRLTELGPRSDVYSLGATLYALLTGRPPFDGEATNVMRDVQEGAFSPPRQVDRRVPPALNAICLKAMSTRPVDRYASCAELADELEAWLADARVRAYRGMGYRTRLWIKRNRTAAVSAGVLLVAALLAGLLAARHASQLNDRIDGQLVRADLLIASGDLERGRAALAVAAALCDDPFTRSAFFRPQIEQRQQQLTKFNEFIRQSYAARFYTPESARNFSSLDTVRQESRDRLLSLCTAALDVYHVRDNPQWEAQLEPGPFSDGQKQRVRDEIGELLVQLALRLAAEYDGTAEAQQRTRTALSYLEQAEPYVPAGPGLLTLRMLWRRRLGDDAGADEAGRQATELARQSSSGGRHVIDQYILAQTTQNILKKPDEAIPLYLSLLRERPDHFRSQFALFDCYGDLGDVAGQLRHIEACLALDPGSPLLYYLRGMTFFGQADYRAAYEDFDTATRKDPQFAIGYYYRGRMQVVFGDWQSAVSNFTHAIELDPKFDSAYSWRGVGQAKLGRHAEAAADAERSLELDPDSPLSYYFAARALALAIAAVRADTDRSADFSALADRYAQRSLEILELGIKRGFDDFTRLAPGSDFDPVRNHSGFRPLLKPAIEAAIAAAEQSHGDGAVKNSKNTLHLGELYLSLGELQSDAVEPDEQAVTAFDKSVQQLQSLVRDEPHRRAAVDLILRALERKAKLLDQLGRREEAEQVWQQLAQLQGPGNRNDLIVQRAYARAQAGDHAGAAAALQPLLEDGSELSGTECYNVACTLSVAVAAIRQDEQLRDEQITSQTEELTKKALGMLERAVRAGFFKTQANVTHMQSDPDFDAIREHEAFRRFTEKAQSSAGDAPESSTGT